jgi:hypothetical protein
MTLRHSASGRVRHASHAWPSCKNPSDGVPLPVVLVGSGYRVRILGPPREHPPPHVHVSAEDGAVSVVRMRLGARAARVWRNDGMTFRQLREVLSIVEEHHDFLMRCWRDLHGNLEDV